MALADGMEPFAHLPDVCLLGLCAAGQLGGGQPLRVCGAVWLWFWLHCLYALFDLLLVFGINISIEKIRGAVCIIGGNADILIGMDIIRFGDFSISNGGGKTLFSFAFPPFENKTDLVEKANRVNKNNKVFKK